ncbi:putative integral membrane protein [Corynebacterium urealyticum]|nr:putative integral membrane protein [Corynebacterium urealyticum]
MRGFTFPMTVFFIVWFVLYVGLAMFAPDFMGIKIWGHINLGVLLGFGQFITTFLITYLYVKYADREIEPRAQYVRESLEGSPATPASQASQG